MNKILIGVFYVLLSASFVVDAGERLDSKATGSEKAVGAERLETIEKRFKDRWQALIDREFETAYGYESPAYRNSVDLPAYVASYHPGLTWTSVAVDEVKIEDEAKAVVSYDLSFKFKTEWGTVLESTDSHTEEWFFKDDEWWHDKKISVSPYSALNQE